jgi:hypothetical protein
MLARAAEEGQDAVLTIHDMRSLGIMWQRTG